MSIRLSDTSDDLPVNHEINVTPFIDVMLVLLIIFMVAAPLATVDVKVDLPASNAAAAPKPDKADGKILVDESIVTLAELGAAIGVATKADKEQRIYLRADKTITYDTIMGAMNKLRSAGYLHVALVGAETTGPQ